MANMYMCWVLIIAGLAVSVLSVLETRIRWVAAFCGLFGNGCRQTEDFTLLRIPIAWWGVAYYTGLALLVSIASPWAFWFVMVGLGFELTFLWIIISIRAFCIFCLLNAAVVVGLVYVFFDSERVWQMAAVALFTFIVSKALIHWENRPDESAEGEESAKCVVAEVAGETITRDELECPLLQRIYQLESEIYRVKQSRLDQMVRNILLEKEAASRNISQQQLLESVVTEHPDVSDKDVDEYIRNNARQLEDWEGSDAELREKIREFLVQRKQQAEIRDYADGLKKKYDVHIFLERPTLPLIRINIEGRPTVGPSGAPVVIVEFSDPFCPACRKAHKTMHQIVDTYGDRIRWVFKDFPIPAHEGAKTAAEAAHCAEEQGKFWEYQDMVFNSQEKPDVDTLKEYAQSLGLDVERFEHCLESGRYESQIAEDMQAGRKVGISATPTFIINGRMISGALSFDDFKERIDQELEAAVSG